VAQADLAVRVDLANQASMAQADPRLADPVDPADLADPASMAQAGLRLAGLVDPADLADPVGMAQAGLRLAGLVDPADLADPASMAQAGLRLAGLVDPADLADPVGPAGPVAHGGMEMGSAATSTAPRGAKGPRPGDTASHPGRDGADRTRRPEGNGITAPSTTGAIRRLPTGIKGSTSGALTSSESGSRCKPGSDGAVLASTTTVCCVHTNRRAI
jgi:hypothetical protein